MGTSFSSIQPEKLDTSILILAAGEHARWPADYPKHLAVLNDGETVLRRTIRQVHERNRCPTVVTVWPQIVSTLGCITSRLEYAELILPEQYWCTIDTFRSTRSVWSKRVIVLLGDVIWTDDAISNILSDATPTIRFHGNFHEMFGFTFHGNMNTYLADIAAEVIKSAKAVGNPDVGKAWQLYRMHCDIPRDEHRIESNCFHKVEDWTNDIDTWGDYQWMLKEHFFKK